ncbi:hypothetical protein [Actinomadura sp. KC06]|uniref:hypothetical protein n=1 Tax=Actinomadura sp. KC06 TaxID=2530369 RepID=UPI001A9D46B0|nr:hypothetical protein [Actinomadura sp. KC06]
MGLDDGEPVDFEPVAWSVAGDDFAVVRETVEDGGGKDLVAEYASHSEKALLLVSRSSLLINFGDRLEDRVGFITCQR